MGGGSDFPGDASGCWARDPDGGAAPDRQVTSVLECTREKYLLLILFPYQAFSHRRCGDTRKDRNQTSK